MKKKGVRVNAGKTRVMWCQMSGDQVEESGVCRKGVGKLKLNFMCLRWVHKRCSDITGKLKSNVDFHCRSCLESENGLFQSILLEEVVTEPNMKLESVPKFGYLGATFCAGGSVDEAARARVRCAWAKFKELSPIPTARGASYRIKGQIYKACVQSVLIFSQTQS